MNLSQYTIKAQEAIQSAQQLAYNNKDAAIETLHLLKAILLDKDSSTEFLLKKNNNSYTFIHITLLIFPYVLYIIYN